MEKDLYDAVLLIWHQYTMEEMLRQSHHPYWCQKNKSLNQMVMVFALKDMLNNVDSPPSLLIQSNALPCAFNLPLLAKYLFYYL